MREQVNWNLLAKHLAGECTDEETARVEAWLSEEPGRRRLLAELEEVWDVTGPAASERDVDALWSRVQDHVRRADGDGPQTPARPDRGREDRQAAPRVRRDRAAERSRTRTGARYFYRASAVVTALVGVVALALWLGDYAGFDDADRDAKVFTTERGQRATIRLVDGTLVRLNAASTLTLKPSFGTRERSVRLEGEAYFDVAHDTSRPFIVRAGEATARVLGTGFNVSAYPDEGQVRVVVAEGKVALHAGAAEGDGAAALGRANDPDARTTGEPVSSSVVLTPRQMGEMDDEGGVVRRSIDVEPHLEWMDGYLHFDGASFEEVARRLSRWYDVDVVVEDGAVPSGHLNARFSDEQPLADVLSVIATVFDLRVERTRDTVHFYPRGSSPPSESRHDAPRATSSARS